MYGNLDSQLSAKNEIIIVLQKYIEKEIPFRDSANFLPHIYVFISFGIVFIIYFFAATI